MIPQDLVDRARATPIAKLIPRGQKLRLLGKGGIGG